MQVFLWFPASAKPLPISPIFETMYFHQRKRLAGPGQFCAGAFAAVGLAGALLLRLQHRRCKRSGGTALQRADRLPLLAAWPICLAAICFFSSTPARAARGSNYRSDLWKHMRGPGPIPLGATLYWSVAAGLLRCDCRLLPGAAARRRDSQVSAFREEDSHHALTPQFCAWGSQVDRKKGSGRALDEAYLTGIYEELKASGMKAGHVFHRR